MNAQYENMVSISVVTKVESGAIGNLAADWFTCQLDCYIQSKVNTICIDNSQRDEALTLEGRLDQLGSDF